MYAAHILPKLLREKQERAFYLGSTNSVKEIIFSPVQEQWLFKGGCDLARHRGLSDFPRVWWWLSACVSAILHYAATCLLGPLPTAAFVGSEIIPLLENLAHHWIFPMLQALTCACLVPGSQSVSSSYQVPCLWLLLSSFPKACQ